MCSQTVLLCYYCNTTTTTIPPSVVLRPGCCGAVLPVVHVPPCSFPVFAVLPESLDTHDHGRFYVSVAAGVLGGTLAVRYFSKSLFLYGLALSVVLVGVILSCPYGERE